MAAPDSELPITGEVDVDLSLERMWGGFREAESWPSWNSCFAWVWLPGGELRKGARIVWVFNPIRPGYLYRMPAIATIVEMVPGERVTWEVTALPGFRARHTYSFEALGPGRSRFASWEVAEGPMYRRTKRFWLAHFRYVCRSSLAGGQELARRGIGVRLREYGLETDEPPLLVIPGLDGSPGSVQPIIARLAERRRVVVADYASERNDSLGALAEEIANVARETRDTEVDLLGQSIGTLVAAEIVARKKLPVRRVALIGTFTRVRDLPVRLGVRLSALAPRAFQELTTPPLMALICGPVRDGRHHPFFAAVRASEPASGRKRTLWQAGRDFAPLLSGIDRPLLVLLGNRDRFPPRGDQERVRAAVRQGARVVGIPDAGHVLLPSAAVVQAADEIERFLE